MRFSSVFQQAPPPPEARHEEPLREQQQPAITPAAELPDDLDARVRLVGEWQLGEGWA